MREEYPGSKAYYEALARDAEKERNDAKTTPLRNARRRTKEFVHMAFRLARNLRGMP